MGRPKEPNARKHIAQVRLSENEYRRCENAAREAGMNLSDWMRHHLLLAAEKR